jgi:hypothetical protein
VNKLVELLTTISHFPIEQRIVFSRLFGGTKNKKYAEYGNHAGSFPTFLKLFVQPEMQQL